MNLTEFEIYAHAEFDKNLPILADTENEARAEELFNDLYTRLEQTAINQGVEVCQRQAWLLVFALYEINLCVNAEELGVPPDYFDRDIPQLDEAYAYLHERRLGAPPRHNDLKVN